MRVHRVLACAVLCHSVRSVEGADPVPASAAIVAALLRSKGAVRLATAVIDEQYHHIATLTAPHTNIEQDCGGMATEGGVGASYHWCKKAFPTVVGTDGLSPHEGETRLPATGFGGKVVEGHSFGIFTWDAWSRRMSNDYGIASTLYDCFALDPLKGIHDDYRVRYTKKDVCLGPLEEQRPGTHYSNVQKKWVQGQRQFHTIHSILQDAHSAAPLSIHMKWDIEGDEWMVLKGMTEADHAKVITFDLEIHWCLASAPDLQIILKELARLRKWYYVTGRSAEHPVTKKALAPSEFKHAGCGPPPQTKLTGGNTGARYGMMSISYVSKRVFRGE